MRFDIIEQAKAIRDSMNAVAANLTDEQAIEVMDLYLPWVANENVNVGDMRRDGEALYRCIQAHTTLEEWRPANTPALWKVVSTDEWPEWVQPTGSHDAYNKGDKVTYNGVHYVSLIDGNVWSPDAHPAGWEAQV